MSGHPSPVPIPAALLRQIGDYLAQRPYREVAMLLSAMQEAVDQAISQASPTPQQSLEPERS